MPIAEAALRTADTSAALLPALAERWSPRAFDPTVTIDEVKLTAALEAARWSPSASNTQPWRFIVARRGSAAFDAVVANLSGLNPTWAASASVLVVAAAEVVDADGKERRWAIYDLGQAVAHLSVQAHHDGLHTHQMGGFDVSGIRAAFGVDERYLPVSITAIGTLGDADALPETLRERERAPRSRHALDSLLLANS